jgi:serine/threonine-protein kinase RsbT
MHQWQQMRIARESDIAVASRLARQAATELGFGKLDSYSIAIAASELACNTLVHGGGGWFALRALAGPQGLALLATDHGPGIADVALALREGYSSIGSLGCGLSGVQRLMDQLEIVSSPGQGARVQACKWR